MPQDPLERDYAEASQALADWFISQDIPVSKAAGIMMYLSGVIIGHTASSVPDLADGIKVHLAVLAKMAKATYYEGRS